jgi:alanyl-tRNA synthetase
LLVDNDVRFLNFCTPVFKSHDYEHNTRISLKIKYIETGIELERIAQILQQASSLYKTDLFFPIIRTTESLAGINYCDSSRGSMDRASEQKDITKISFHVIADHVRVLVNFIADNVSAASYNGKEPKTNVPYRNAYLRDGITGVPLIKEYISRLLLHGQILNISRLFITDIALEKIRLAENSYPKINQNLEKTIEILQLEEYEFLTRLNSF